MGMKSGFTTVFTVVLIGAKAWAQAPKEPVWVPQAPPFGTIAALAGFPELRAVYPMAGPLVIDVRVAEWSPMGVLPSRFLRLADTGNDLKAAMYLWWIGPLGPYEPPASTAIQCTTPREGPRTCILPIALNVQRDWRSVLNRVLAADVCPVPRPTDMYELRVQVFERVPYPRYRDSELCEPLASEFRALFDKLVPNDFRRRQ
jgi:hypothetical protein